MPRTSERPRILVTGSRTWNSVQIIWETLARLRDVYPDAVLVHGGAQGADQIAAHVWGKEFGLPTEEHRPDYARHGSTRAPWVRNAHMVKLGADVCVAYIRNGSSGATGTAKMADEAGIPVILVPLDDKEAE